MPCSECGGDNLTELLMRFQREQQETVMNMHRSNQDILMDIKEESGLIKADVSKANTSIAGMREEILGEGGRIPKIEDKMKSDENWNRVGKLMGPLTIGFYALLRHFGVKI